MKDKARGGTLDVTSKFLDWEKKIFVTRYITETVEMSMLSSNK